MNPTKSAKKKILFVYTGFSSFVKNDFDILQSAHLVKSYHFTPVKGVVKNGIEILRQLLFLLINGWRTDLFFIWFSDYHTFLPVFFAKIFGKKSIVVIGGYDVCRIRKLNYGAFCSSFRGWFCAGSMRRASLLLTVSGQVDRKTNVIAPLTPRLMVYNCVSPGVANNIIVAKRDAILTVGLIDNERTFYLKGIDTYLEVARLLPDYRFDIVGIDSSRLSELLEDRPVNVHLSTRIAQEQLVDFYARSRIYCQLSRSESFGVSIAEAMTFGNFPIVTNEGGMPEIIGEAGAVVRRQSEAIAELIDRVMRNEHPVDTRLIRRQVEENFSHEGREKQLLKILREL
jgi:glycosyltransferase involved in cell wall biosynthesis